jgi:hypothetical protein
MPSVDRARIVKAMQLSALAYGSDDEIRALGDVRIERVNVDVGGRPSGLAEVKFFVWHDAAGPDGPRSYLAIRGTANPGDIFLDLDYPKRHDDALDLWVHGGFSAAAEKVLERLATMQLPAGEPLWVTGHSLGGAAALLVYLRLNHDHATLGPLITFGQPKAVADAARERFGCLPIFRVVDEGDFVPLLPPTLKDKGCKDPTHPGCHGSFAHLGDELAIAADGTCAYRTYHDADALGAESFESFLQDAEHKDLAKYLTDHLPDAYLGRVQGWGQGTSAPPCVFHERRW